MTSRGKMPVPDWLGMPCASYTFTRNNPELGEFLFKGIPEMNDSEIQQAV
jgi:hypothetical protein